MKHESLQKLNECLRSELSAVETYELALKGVEHVGVRHTLQEILTSHARRAGQLRQRIAQLGAVPPEGSGIWGAFAKAMQAGADLLGDRAAVAALEEGEDREIKLYSEGLSQCDTETQRLLSSDLLPQEQHTHELCRSLKTYLSAAS